MKKYLSFVFGLMVLFFLALPCRAADKTYTIEFLQVAKIEAFQVTYDSFINELAKSGLVVGKNLKVNRVILEYNMEKAGFFDKMGLLFKIRSEAGRIADAKPDLAVTIGTPATKYGRDKITGAGIPLVFSAVAMPVAAGCKSLTEGGPAVTGATLYMDMKNALKIVRAAFPTLKTIGIVYSDDDSAIAHVKDATSNGPSFGFNFISKQVNKKDDIIPHLKSLREQGAEAYIIPLDTYYGIRDFETVNDMVEYTRSNKIPVISFAVQSTKGAVLAVGTGFDTVGKFAAQNAAKILLEGKKPESLPIRQQEDLKIVVDVERMQALGIQIPMGILQLAKPASDQGR